MRHIAESPLNRGCASRSGQATHNRCFEQLASWIMPDAALPRPFGLFPPGGHATSARFDLIGYNPICRSFPALLSLTAEAIA
jgi:hypothetical protein